MNSYSYDTLSRLDQVIQQQQAGGNTVAPKEIDYAYNAIGQVTGRSGFNFIGVGPRYDIATSTMTYNPLGLVAGISMTSDGGQVALDNLTYSFDSLARVSTFGSVDGTATYGYDPTSQLTSATYVAASGHTEPPNFSVTFDPNGTRRSANGVSTTVGTDNHLTNDGTFTFAYDAAGNLTTRTRISNAAANDYQTVYDWDYRNRLTDVYFYNTSGTLTQHVHYVYDVWNNLIERDLDPNGSGSYSQIVHYVWDGNNVVLAFNGSEQLTARCLNGPNTSAYDQYYSTLAEEDVTSTGQGGTLTFPLLDQQGSVVDIADDSGNLADHIVYVSTGGVFSESNPSIPHIAGFQGGYVDATTGMEHFGARWEYMADAIWASQDPIGLAGGINLTEADGNDPVNLTDPSGHEPKVVTQIVAALKAGDIDFALTLLSGAGYKAVSAIPHFLAKFQQQAGRLSDGRCVELAKRTFDVFTRVKESPQIIQITDKYGARIWHYGQELVTTRGFHQVVQNGGKIYDKITGANGMLVDDYIKLLKSMNLCPVFQVIKQ